MVRSSCHWQKSIRFTFYSFWPTLRRLFVKSFFFYCFHSIQFIFSFLFFLLLLLFLISEISKAYLVNRRMEERAKESAVGCWNIKFIFCVTELKTFWLEVWQYLHLFLVFTTQIRFVYISYWFHLSAIISIQASVELCSHKGEHRNGKPLVKAKTPRTKWYPAWTHTRERGGLAISFHVTSNGSICVRGSSYKKRKISSSPSPPLPRLM